MNAQQIVALAARLFSIWIFTYAMRCIVGALGAGDQLQGSGSLIFGGIGMAIAVIALLVWQFPMAIANQLIPRTHSMDVIRMPARQVAALATATLSIWIIIEAIPFVSQFVQAILSSTYAFTPKEMMYMLVSLVPMAIGVYLLKRPFAVADRILPAQAGHPVP